MSFLSPKIEAQAPPPGPPNPYSTDPTVAGQTSGAMGSAMAGAAHLAQGRASTILTGGAGLEGPAMESKRSILGV